MKQNTNKKRNNQKASSRGGGVFLIKSSLKTRRDNNPKKIPMRTSSRISFIVLAPSFERISSLT